MSRSHVFVGVVALLAACSVTEESLSTVEQHAVSFSMTSGGFPSTQVGSTSAPIGFEIYPVVIDPYSQYSYDSIDEIYEACPDFEIQAALPGYVYYQSYCPYGDPYWCQYYGYPVNYEYQSFYFTATFTPTVAGTTSCDVYVYTTSGVYTLNLSGTGTLPPVDINVTPSSVAFGQVRRLTDSSNATITVRNFGGQQLNVNQVSISGAGASAYAIVQGSGGISVAPGGNYNYALRCTPPTTGTFPASFVITSNDPAKPTVSIPLSCTGIDSNLQVSPSPLALGTTRVGEPLARSVSLVNVGTASSTIESVAVTGSMTADTASLAGVVLSPGGSTNVDVQFAADAAGEASGELVVTHDGGQVRTVPVTAQALATSISITPGSMIDLGPVCTGQSRDQDVTIRANAAGAFLVTAVASPEPPFTLSTPTLPATVQGSGSNQVVLGVAVAVESPGALTSSISLETDIPGGMAHVLELRATGLPPGVSASPATVDFGLRPVDETTIGRTVYVANCLENLVEWSNPRIEGPDAGEFAIVATPAIAEITPTAAAEWLVVMQPRSPGAKVASFLVDHPGGTVEVALTGAGGGGELPAELGPDRLSYYECSTGTARAAWPPLLALALVLRRRTRR